MVSIAPGEVAGVVGALSRACGIDFSDYRAAPIASALETRMRALGLPSVSAYRELVERDPLEQQHLRSALVVPVTRLFRDPEVFEAVRTLLGAARSGQRSPAHFRALAVGVASGEEAWSLAAVLADVWEDGRGTFEVLGTDLDEASLAIARRGEYAASIETVPERHRRCFASRDGGLVVNDALRSHVTFATHDLVGQTLAPSEALIASFQLVFFRNVLIYFERPLQKRALGRIAAMLDPGGLLVLGHVESLPVDLTSELEPHRNVDERLRIFRRR